jgi:cellobiose phosphorylase
MQYGHFSGDKKEYIITRPDTPRPWFNYLFNDVYHALVSSTGGGYSYLKDPKYHRILRYDHISTDRPGRYIYAIDRGTNETWSLTWQPTRKPLAAWQCRHGLGYTAVSCEHVGIKSEITYFVTQKDPVEVWHVTVKNTTDKPKKISLFPFVEFVCGDIALEMHYRNILSLYNEADYDKRLNAIVAFKHPFKEHIKYGFGFFATSANTKGYDCRKETFVGRYNDVDAPEVLKNGSCKNSYCRGDDMVGVFQIDLSLDAGAEEEFVVLLGCVEERKDIRPILDKYNHTSAAKNELKAIKEYWQGQIDRIYVKTPDEDFNTMVDIWGKYQLFAITHWRGTSHYHGVEGGLGFRDTAQDSEGLLSVDQELARKKLEKILYYQYNSGHAVSGFSDIEGTWENQGQAGIVKKADVAVWVPYTVVSYIKETGDVKFLDKVVEFHDKGSATVYEHVLRAVRYIYSQRGRHGLPLIGYADWNDAYDAVGNKGKGESVWLGMALCRAAKQVEELADFIGDKKVSAEMKKIYEELYEIINKIGWDGSWYLAAFNDEGRKIGSNANEEGKVPLNSQTWAILSGIVTKERLPKILDRIDNYLDTDFGPALFLPSYTSYNPGIGRVTAFAEGTKENAAVFSHACAFKIVADCTIKRGQKAYDTFKKLMPMSKFKEDHDRYKVEPYVWAEYVIGPGSKYRFGEGAFTWNTGTTPWMFTAATEWMLGVRRELNGLLIDPCLPPQWKECFIRRPYRGAVYEVTIKNPEGVESGIQRLVVDGKEVASNLIKPYADGKVHKVEVLMGSKVGAVACR